MKTLVLLALLLTVTCRAADTNITSKVFEHDRDKDGKPDFRAETLYRGKTKVMLIWNNKDKNGKMQVTSRSYLVGGKLAMTEADNDQDGVFETVVVYNSKEQIGEVFIRQLNGSVKPASAQYLQSCQKEDTAISEAAEELLSNKEMSDQEISGSLQKTIDKIRQAQKELKAAKLEDIDKPASK